jgi:hypothetical protein
MYRTFHCANAPHRFTSAIFAKLPSGHDSFLRSFAEANRLSSYNVSSAKNKYYGYPAWHQWDATMPAWNPDWRNDPNSTGYGIINGLLPAVEMFKALEGSSTTRGRKWRANFVTNYRFEGKLRGFSIGGAARWRSPDTIGYFGKQNPLNPSGPLISDVSRPIHGDSELFFDGWAAYEHPFKLGAKVVDWSVQLNIRNLLNNDKVTAISAYVDGTRTGYIRNEPINVSLTSSFKF